MKRKFNSKFTYIVGFAALCIWTLQSCSNSDSDGSGSARLQVSLVDAPGDYQEVNIDVQDIQINSSSEEGGFVSLENVETGIYNILELTGGLEALLADNEIPTGNLSQIRLILGDSNTLKLDDQVFDLTIPSGSQSGLKLNVNITLEEGITYDIKLDFDAARSVVMAGNSGKYNLKPVIRTIVEATSGAISGTLDPVASAAVYAIIGDDSVSTYTDDQGFFLIGGLDVGTYDVYIQPSTEDELQEKTEEDIVVVIGEINDLGVIALDAVLVQ